MSKKLIFGGVLGVVVLVGLLYAGILYAQERAVRIQQGNWQIIFSPHARADTFLLNTETGDVFQLVGLTGGEKDGKKVFWKMQIWQDKEETQEE